MPFFAPVAAFFLLAVVADEVAGAADALDVVAVEVVLEGEGVELVATFLFDAFFAGDAERFRLVPAAALGLLDERDFFALLALAGFFAPLGLFDRLRDLAGADFFFPAAVFFAGEPDPPNLKLPLAPTPFVCFNEVFFVPARKADLRC